MWEVAGLVGQRGPKPDMTLPDMNSSVLDRVKQFLPEIDAANQRLRLDMEAAPQDTFDIETVSDEQPHIEMNLACGVIDLKGDDAIKAATAAMDGNVPTTSRDKPQTDDCDTSTSAESDSDDDELQCKHKISAGVEAVSTDQTKDKKYKGIVELT
eukprot:scaffold189020_cov37-Prasinocladus_malaysianus.AAC.2